MAATESPGTCTSCGAETRDGFGCLACLVRLGFDETLGDVNGAAALQSLPDQFGHYTIDSHPDGSAWELGRGAMGVTFRALDTSLERPVALKILHTEVPIRGAGARERFMREARAAAALRHPNIATVYHFGIREETGQCFYAMELVEGETLESYVRRTGPMNLAGALDAAQQIAQALAVAAERGLVHRDLKPSNIMIVDAPLARDRTVKVIDFGLAKALTDQADPMTATRNGFIGTPAFASPEQFAHGPIDARSDIYSLGATIWFLLTGHTIFPGHTLEQIRDKQRAVPLPLEQLKAARVPAGVRSLVASMLTLEPAARPDARQLAAQIERCRASLAKGNRRLLFVAGAAAVTLSTAFFIFRAVNNNRRATPAAEPSQKSIAVLPFENLSRDADNAYFADSIQDQILTRLVKVADLKVISRSSTQRYAGVSQNLPQVGKQLGVANLLQGTVQKEHDLVRVTVQLINLRNNVSVWAETYDRTTLDLFQVESDVAQRVASALEAKLTNRERSAIKAIATSNEEAYQAYLKGRYFWNKRSIDGYKEAVNYFNQAIALDPNYAQAYAGLGDVYLFLADENVGLRKEYYARSQTASRRALDLDPMLAEAHASLGLSAMNYDRNWAAAEKEFQEAIALNPNYATAHHWYAEDLATVGRFEESLREIERARELDPWSPAINSDGGKFLYFARRYDEAKERLTDTLKMDGSFAAAHYWLGWVELEMKHYDQALAEFSQVQNLFGRGYVYGVTGRKSEAKEMLEASKQHSPGQPVNSLHLAFIYIGLGEKDEAFACLEREYETHSAGMTSLKVAPYYDPLRSDPRFADLLRRVHLAP
jgi:serine/threonine protein kinase/predicted Zn-dependent protease